MKPDRFTPFPNTHWSLVDRAKLADSGDRQKALIILLQRYQPTLRSYLALVLHLKAQEIDDVFSSFVTDKLLQQKFLAHADHGRGRFRTFLLTSLNNYVTSWNRQRNVRATLPLEDESLLSSPSSPTPQAIVEASWARTLLLNVIETMRLECRALNRNDIWTVFEGRILGQIFEDRVPVTYARLASILELQSPAQAANLLVTAKRMYIRLLRSAVGEYEREEAITQEIAELQAILARGISAVD